MNRERLLDGTYVVECPVCQEIFGAHRIDMVYCSDRCRRDASRVIALISKMKTEIKKLSDFSTGIELNIGTTPEIASAYRLTKEMSIEIEKLERRLR